MRKATPARPMVMGLSLIHRGAAPGLGGLAPGLTHPKHFQLLLDERNLYQHLVAFALTQYRLG